ncbi:unnamed protein product [Peronospora destructor]|uniref:Uncharacterized protein n=1 Tax=Peronospora destructor TaxID=86335 RepID=A0AAV0U6U0_9STRA|nr:unnamed protein product [Peronospora destructor]
MAIFATTECSSDFVVEVKAGDIEHVGVIWTRLHSTCRLVVHGCASFKVDVEGYAGDAVHHMSHRFGLIKVGGALECQTVDQCWSLVDESRLRFDFTNSKALEAPSWRVLGWDHLKNTKKAKTFVQYEEGVIAKDVHRVSAYTSDLAVEAESMGPSCKLTSNAIDKLDGIKLVEHVYLN